MSQKRRFCELSTEEIQQIMDKAVPETTEKATKFGMRLFVTFHGKMYINAFPFNSLKRLLVDCLPLKQFRKSLERALKLSL